MAINTTTLKHHITTGLKSIVPQASGYFGARLVTRYTLTAVNPFAASASFATASLVRKISDKTLDKTCAFITGRLNKSLYFSYTYNQYNIRTMIGYGIHITSDTLAFASGVAIYAAISTLTTTHLIGINILAFAANFAANKLF